MSEVWVYLAASPLLWLTATLAAYLLALRIARVFGNSPLANVVLIATAIIVVLLLATGSSYEQYFDGAQFIHFLLGPATVALAVPLHAHLAAVRRSLLPIAVALLVGAVTAAGSAVVILWAFGAPWDILVSIAPKSVTTPIAMKLSESLGGLPSLTAVIVIVTGVVGAIIVTPLMNLLGIRDFAARGFALGIASHGIGTARAFQVNEVAGVFAGVAMGLNGALTSALALIWVLAVH